MTKKVDRPLLLFFTTSRSGPARRMESLLAHLARKERARLRVSLVDAGEAPELAEKLKITEIPTLVLVKDRRPVARLEGRASEPQIQRMIAPYLSNPRHELLAALAKHEPKVQPRPALSMTGNPVLGARQRSSEDAGVALAGVIIGIPRAGEGRRGHPRRPPPTPELRERAPPGMLDPRVQRSSLCRGRG